MAYKTPDHVAFGICSMANTHWVDPDGEDMYGCDSTNTIASCPQDLGCYECMKEQVEDLVAYHNDIDAAWNAAKGIH